MNGKHLEVHDEGITVPTLLKDKLKELALLVNDTTQFGSKTERTAFLFTLIMLLRDYVVFATISESNNINELNKYINEYKINESDPIREAAR